MPRCMLSDEQWSKLKGIMLQEKIYDKRDVRLMVEGMLYRMRVGCPWRDLPSYFGRQNSIYTTFNRGSKKGKWITAFKKLSQDTDTEWKFIDGTYVKAHQHSAGACSEDAQAIGKSCAGLTTKNSFGCR